MVTSKTSVQNGIETVRGRTPCTYLNGITQSGMNLEDYESDITKFLGTYFNDRHNKILNADVEEMLILAIRRYIAEANECEPENKQ